MEPADQIRTILNRLFDWAHFGSKDSVDRVADLLAVTYRNTLNMGLDAYGKPLAALKESTLNAPIRREDNQTIRKTTGATPLRATGETASSLKKQRKSSVEWEISSDSERSNAILVSNAKMSHSGKPFFGDTPKAIRDPIQVTDKQLDFFENNLLRELDRVVAVI